MKRPDWQQQGAEPDYRFTLANERTFLAWIRTALAVLGGGVLLHQFGRHVEPRSILSATAFGLALLGAVMAALAYYRWKGNEIAMRQASNLPPSMGIPVLCTSIGVVALVLAVGLILNAK